MATDAIKKMVLLGMEAHVTSSYNMPIARSKHCLMTKVMVLLHLWSDTGCFGGGCGNRRQNGRGSLEKFVYGGWHGLLTDDVHIS